MSNSNVHSQQAASTEEGGEGGDDAWNPYYFMRVKVELRETGKYGNGLFLMEDVKKDTVLWLMEKDDHMCQTDLTSAEIREMYPTDEEFDDFIHWFYQIGDDLFTGPVTEEDRQKDVSVYWNHSCNSNTGFVGDYCIAARRDIKAGEQLTFDYCQTESKYPFFDGSRCMCGEILCRGEVGPDDWKKPEVRAMYDGYFAPYLQAKIDAEKAEASQIAEAHAANLMTTGIALGVVSSAATGLAEVEQPIISSH